MKSISTRIGGDFKFRFGIWTKKAADTLSAALCGIFVAAGLISLADNGGGFRGRGDIIRVLLLAVFALTAVCGIYGRQRLMPKAFFALSLTAGALLCPPSLGWAVQVLLCPLMVLPLYFGARWRGARFAILPLILLASFQINVPRHPAERRSENIPLPLYLPSALLHEQPGGAMLFFGDPDPEGDEVLNHIVFRSGWMRADSPRVTLGIAPKRNRFRIAVAGRSSRVDGVPYRSGVYRWLVGRLEDDGVLVLPTDETPLLPPGDWRIAVMPGCGGKWAAARRGKEVCADPEKLDDRVAQLSSPPLLPAGAVSAVCLPPPECELTMPPLRTRWFADPWNWFHLAAVAAVWVILRLLLCRRAKAGTAAAAAETAAAMVLYSLAAFPKWNACMMDTGISPYALFAGIGLLLVPRPFHIVRNIWRVMTGFAVGILPWLPGCDWCWLPLLGWFSWFLAGAAVFTGIRRDDRRAALIGAPIGAVLGILLYLTFGAGGSALPVCIAAALLIPSWLRR